MTLLGQRGGDAVALPALLQWPLVLLLLSEMSPLSLQGSPATCEGGLRGRRAGLQDRLVSTSAATISSISTAASGLLLGTSMLQDLDLSGTPEPGAGNAGICSSRGLRSTCGCPRRDPGSGDPGRGVPGSGMPGEPGGSAEGSGRRAPSRERFPRRRGSTGAMAGDGRADGRMDRAPLRASPSRRPG